MPQREHHSLPRRESSQRLVQPHADLPREVTILSLGSRRSSHRQDQLLIIRRRPAPPELPLSGPQPIQARVHRNSRYPACWVVQLFRVFLFERLIGLQKDILRRRISLVAILEKTLAQRIDAPLFGDHPRAKIAQHPGFGLLRQEGLCHHAHHTANRAIPLLWTSLFNDSLRSEV